MMSCLWLESGFPVRSGEIRDDGCKDHTRLRIRTIMEEKDIREVDRILNGYVDRNGNTARLFWWFGMAR